MKLEKMFRRVHANSANLFHGRSPLFEICNDLILAQSMPSGAVHPIIQSRLWPWYTIQILHRHWPGNYIAGTVISQTAPQGVLIPDPVPSAGKVAYTTPLAIKKKAMETDSFKIYG
jgi:hypothetical protein